MASISKSVILADNMARLREENPVHHRHRLDRVAVTVRRRHGPLKATSIGYDEFNVLTLQRRICEHRGRLHRRTLLIGYAARVDLHPEGGRVVGTGRIGFAPVLVRDLAIGLKEPGPVRPLDVAAEPKLASDALAMARAVDDVDGVLPSEQPPALDFLWSFEPGTNPVREPAIDAVEWAINETAIGDNRAWPAAFFARDRTRIHPTHPIDGSPNPLLQGPEAVDAPAPGWCWRDGRAYPDCQAPSDVRVRLRDWAGRTVRNPAYEALRRTCMIQGQADHAAWLRDHAGPGSDAARARLLSRIESMSRADMDRALAITAAAAESDGVPFERGVELDRGDLPVMLQEPWLPAYAPDRAAIRVYRLAGLPSPETMAIETATYSLNLYDCGEAQDACHQASEARVVEYTDQAAASRRHPNKQRRLPWRQSSQAGSP